MTTLDRYWPTQTNVAKCIRTEAEVVDDAVLLAVHEPGPLITIAVGGIKRPATEGNLLESLMRDASDGSAVLVAITGESGVGKSHMVRWLHAQLQRHPRHDQLVIVLVPKTASLRQVVERILEPLQGAAYEHLLAELSKAVEHLQPRDAAALLGTALSNELAQKLDSGMEALRQTGSDNRLLRERLGLTKKLRDLIREPDVLDGWFSAVLERIVRQTLEGGSETGKGELRRFVPEDLVIPDDWSQEIIKPAVQSALQQLTRNDGASRPLAAEILQDALDPALRTVFQFSKALGQRTIEEIVDEIRQALLEDGKELVLLIEDFAALAGIQQPLLNLIIAESDHGGERVRAPIRTALAVTDGFLPGRQTILTRAKQEWFIPNTEATPEAIIDRLTDLAGRYLNAARWGTDALQEQFRKHKTAGLDNWVVAFREPLSAEDEDKLSAFGTSRQGYPLFPLSKISIDAMCRRELRVGNELRFNPRNFINVVLRETLNLRPLFEAGAFPPPNFKAAAPPGGVVIALATRGWPEEQCKRLESMLDYWAGNPASLAEPPRIGRGVFDAFHLPWPFADKGDGAPPPPPPPLSKGPENPPPLVDLVPTAPEYIETWATGNIPENKARQVRNLLEVALNERIDWGIARVRGRRVEAGQIWLPFARIGNPSTEPKFVVADETRPLDAVLRAGLTALERWLAKGKSWDYPQSEDDYPLAQQLLDRLESQVVAWTVAFAERQAIVALRVMHRQALLLSLTRSTAPQAPTLSDYCEPLPEPLWTPDPEDTRPQALVAQAKVRAEAARAAIKDVLTSAAGCYQGTGAIPYAVDFRRIKSAWRQDLPEVGARLIKAGQGADQSAVDEIITRIETLLTRCQTAIQPLLPAIQEKLGDSVNAGLGTTLLEQLEQARKAGLFPVPSSNYEQSKKAVDKLSSDAARSLIRKAMAFIPPEVSATVETRLATWATLNMKYLLDVKEAIDHLDKTFKELERAADAQLKNTGGGDISEMLACLQSDLEQIVQEQEQ
ncbi:ATP-binding protein [Candidatus Kaiserbacteria bacterium]|nr:ATP-binding protein [Candidatus Kaiserbacteria bacterium]